VSIQQLRVFFKRMVNAQSSGQSIKQTNTPAQKLDPVKAIDYSDKPTGGIKGGIVIKGPDVWKSRGYGSSGPKRSKQKETPTTAESSPAPVEVVSSTYTPEETKTLVEAQGFRLKPASSSSNASSPYYNKNVGENLLNQATDFNNPNGPTVEPFTPKPKPLTNSEYFFSAVGSIPQAYTSSLITTGKVASDDFYNAVTSGPRALSKYSGIPIFEVGSVSSPVINYFENYKPTREERTTAYINIAGMSTGLVAGGAFGGLLGSVPVRASAVGVGSALYGSSIATSIYNFKLNPSPQNAGGVVAVLAPGIVGVGYQLGKSNQVPTFTIKQSEAPITTVKQIGDRTYQINTYGKAELKQVGVYGSEKSTFVTQSVYNLDEGFVSNIKIRGLVGNAKTSKPFAKVATVKGSVAFDEAGYIIGEGKFFSRDAFTNVKYSSGVYSFKGSPDIVLGTTLSKNFGVVNNKIAFDTPITKGMSINYPNAYKSTGSTFEVIPSQGSANQYYGVNKQINQIGLLQNTIGSSTIPKSQSFNSMLAVAPIVVPVSPSPQNRNYLPPELFQVSKQDNKNFFPSNVVLNGGLIQDSPTRTVSPSFQPGPIVSTPSPSRVRPAIQITPPILTQPPISPTLQKETTITTTAPPYFNPVIPTSQEIQTPSFYFSLPPTGSDNYLSSIVVTGARKRTRYTPSFTALLYKIPGKKNIKTETGINFRPIPKGYNLFRWNKKR
jgi:hypothetical protein